MGYRNASDIREPIRILYLCCTQFSGSTLTSFLLGTHSRIATVGHTMGWQYAADEDFRCSCGDRIADCSLFAEVGRRFEQAGLAFDPRDFGTSFRLSRHRRLNQLLLESIPFVRVSAIEDARDRLVGAVPPWRRAIDRQYLANEVLMRTVLDYFDAEVYLDNSHSAYRLKRLAGSADFSPIVIHLIRDPRGVSRSLMRNSGYTCKDAIKVWLSDQQSIVRIAGAVCEPLLLRYEDLCRETSTQLARIHDHCSLGVEEFGGNFKDAEHHILGNRMRLSHGDIRLDEKWRDELSPSDRNLIDNALQKYVTRQAGPLTPLIRSYLDGA